MIRKERGRNRILTIFFYISGQNCLKLLMKFLIFFDQTVPPPEIVLQVVTFQFSLFSHLISLHFLLKEMILFIAPYLSNFSFPAAQ